MGQRMWLGAWVLVLGLGGAGVACDGGSGGSGGGGGTGTFECPMRSQACEQCRADNCSANCKSADCQTKLEGFKDCVCGAQEAGEDWGSCGGDFSAGDADANSYQQCINYHCGKEAMCNY